MPDTNRLIIINPEYAQVKRLAILFKDYGGKGSVILSCQKDPDKKVLESILKELSIEESNPCLGSLNITNDKGDLQVATGLVRCYYRRFNRVFVVLDGKYANPFTKKFLVEELGMEPTDGLTTQLGHAREVDCANGNIKNHLSI